MHSDVNRFLCFLLFKNTIFIKRADTDKLKEIFDKVCKFDTISELLRIGELQLQVQVVQVHLQSQESD